MVESPTINVKGTLQSLHSPLNLDPAFENAIRVQNDIDPSVEITESVLKNIYSFILRSADFGGNTLQSLAGLEYLSNNSPSLRINDEDWSAANYTGIFDTIGEFRDIEIYINISNNISIRNLFGLNQLSNVFCVIGIHNDTDPSNVKYFTTVFTEKQYSMIIRPLNNSNITFPSIDDLVDFNNIPKALTIENNTVDSLITINSLETTYQGVESTELYIGKVILPSDLTPIHKYVNEFAPYDLDPSISSLRDLINAKTDTSKLTRIALVRINFDQNITELSQSTYNDTINITFIDCYYNGDLNNKVTQADIDALEAAKPNWVINYGRKENE